MKNIDTLNIAHVVFSFDYGGLERRILRLIETLSGSNCRFYVISLRHSDGNFLDQGFPVEHINVHANPGIDVAAIKRVASLLKQHQVHIVHSHNWISMLEGALAAKLAKTPVSVHGEHGAKRFQDNELVWRRTFTQRVLCRLSDQIIPVNDAINKRLQELWWLPESRLTTIRNGVDTNKFQPKRMAKLSRDDTIHIGSISRLDPVKNFPCLIKACAFLNEKPGSRRYRLTIVGGGAELDDLNTLVTSLNAAEYINFPGPTDSAEDWYPNFDIYVNSSFSEGMSNTVLEAMSCGLPIVATNVDGHRDWLRENEHALFFESEDHRQLAAKIEYLAENEDLRLDCGTRNRQYIESEFSQDQFVQRYKKLYSALLTKAGIAFEF